jgi:hypothetical protein
VTGSKDGTGSAAQFNKPEGVAVDGGGNVFVADTGNNTIRKITSAGVVTTIAGTAGVTGNFDGIGLTAQFNGPSRVAVDATGNVYVADAGNDEVRRIAAGGVVTTLAGGSPYYIGFGDGVGASVWFHFLNGIATDPSGNVFVATTNQTIMEGVPAMAPTVTLSPAASTVASGRSVVFNAVGTGLPAPTYQWTLNGSGNIPGAAVTTDRVLLVSGTTAADAGTYACTVTNGAGSASASGTLTVTSTPTPGYLTNLSARANVGTGANILIAGFGVGGSGSTDLLLRGVGPGLATISTLTGILSNPALTLFDSAPVPGPYPIVTGQGWGGGLAQGTSSIDIGQQPATANLMASVGAFTLSAGSADSAMEVTPPAGNYTAQISGVGNTVGVALAEIYDVDGVPLTARLVNVSARAGVGTGNNVLIGGFSIAGATSETVLIRAVGPGLAGLGVPGILIQPTLTIYSGATPIYANTVWAGDPIVAAIFPVVGAFSLNTASSDSVLLLTLAPGNYTAQVTGVNNGTGIALVEIYEVF